MELQGATAKLQTYLLWLLAKDNKETHIPYVSESFFVFFFALFHVYCIPFNFNDAINLFYPEMSF